MKATIAIGLCVLAIVGCGDQAETSPDTSPKPDSTASTEPELAVTGPEPRVRAPEGRPPKTLVVRELSKGTGPGAQPGDELTTQFVAVFVTGKQFESSWEAGSKPFSFRLGANEASPAWERGLRGMKVGGQRELIVPPRISSRFGTPPESGPEDTLVYMIELLALDPPGPDPVRSIAVTKGPTVKPPSGPPPSDLIVETLRPGKGAKARAGDQLTVEYVGVYYNGRPFTNSWERSKPFRFVLGSEDDFTNPGWERGLRGMRVGERRELIVPPRWLFRGGPPPGSKPKDTIVYVIDLVSLRPPPSG